MRTRLSSDPGLRVQPQAEESRHATHHLAPDFQGCGHTDPDHSYDGGRIEFNDGACDGWLRAGDNDEFAIGYYTKKDLAFLGAADSIRDPTKTNGADSSIVVAVHVRACHYVAQARHSSGTWRSPLSVPEAARRHQGAPIS